MSRWLPIGVGLAAMVLCFIVNGEATRRGFISPLDALMWACFAGAIAALATFAILHFRGRAN